MSQRLTAAALGLTTIATTFATAPAQALPTTMDLLCDELGAVSVQKQSGAAGTSYVTSHAAITFGDTGLACRESTVDAEGHYAVKGGVVTHALVDTESLLDAVEPDSTSGARSVRAAAATDPAGYGAVTKFPYQSQLANYLAGRPGNVGVAWRKQGTSTIYHYYKGRSTNICASIVKVQIMAAVMTRAQTAGRGLTAWEKSQLAPMIIQSDNTAATNLYRHIGGAPSLAASNARMGLRSTVPDSAWGMTVTNAPDQVVLVDHFARKNPVINDANRSYGLSLLRQTGAWGVTAGPGAGIAHKNGWLPRVDGWHVNSIGYNHRTPGAYSVAVLTHATNSDKARQTTTIEGASRIMYGHRNDAAVAPRPVLRGDWNGDGRADLVGTKDGKLYLMRGAGGGKLMSAVQIGGSGWGGMTWLGVPGDLTGDRRSDLLARRSDGTLWLYRSTGSAVTEGRQIGKGWNGMTAMSAVGDFNANGLPDILARHRNGDLLRYEILSGGGAVARARVGVNWNQMVAIMGVNGIDGDKKADVLAMNANGRLYRYYSTGASLRDGVEVGHGWRPSLVTIPGDLTGDGIEDIAYQTSNGLKVYPVAKGGSVRPPVASGLSLTGYRRLA